MNDESEISFGCITKYFSQGYGFIQPLGQAREVYFHVSGGRKLTLVDKEICFDRSSKLSYDPRPGEEVVFLLADGSKGRPKAFPWGFRFGANGAFEELVETRRYISLAPRISLLSSMEGLVLPKWADMRWRFDECEIRETEDEYLHMVIDASLRIAIYVGSLEKCRSFLERHSLEGVPFATGAERGICGWHGYFKDQGKCPICAAGN